MIDRRPLMVPVVLVVLILLGGAFAAVSSPAGGTIVSTVEAIARQLQGAG